MRFLSWLNIVTVACFFWLISWFFAPAAFALVQIQVSDLSYSECPPELAEGTVIPGGSSGALANCFLVHGKAINKSGKMVVNADIYGRIYDANGNPILQNRTRLGSIDQVPPGSSDFELRITVPANQPTPLKLEQFKASGFTGQVRR